MVRSLIDRMAKPFIVAVVSILAISSFTSCSLVKKSRSQPRYGGTYRYCSGESISTFDPALCSWVADVEAARLIYNTLVCFNRDTLKIEPGLAKDWKFSKDGKTWTFYLRKGVKFHNGREVTANDFVYSFTRLVDPKLDAVSADVFGQVEGLVDFQQGKVSYVKGFKALDKYTLQIKLTQPMSPFLSMLTLINAAVVPKEAVEAKGGLEKFPVGTGPFKFKKYTKDKYVLLKANKAYYAGRPYLDKVKLVIFLEGDYSKMIEEFKKGNLDQVYVSSECIKEAKKIKKGTLKGVPAISTAFLLLRTTTPPFDNKQVRQAFSQLVNRQKLVKLSGLATMIAHCTIPPGIPGHNPALRINEYNPKNAERLLKESGYPEGEGLPTINFYYLHDVDVPVLKQVKEDAGKLGFKVAINKVSEDTFNQKIEDSKSDFAGAVLTWFADYDDLDNILYSFFSSESPVNYACYNNPQVDELLAQARAIPDPASTKRIKLYQEAERIVLEDAPVVPLRHEMMYHLVQPYVRGLALNDLGEGTCNFQKIWLEKH